MDNAIPSRRQASTPVPPRAGVGLKAQHYRTVIDRQPDLGWFEVHPENYMGDGGPPLRFLEHIRRDYPLSLHGVGMSLGSCRPLDRNHLQRFRALIDRFEPGLVSEHLSWGHGYDWYTHDLLPLPYTEASLRRVVDHIDQAQEALGRQLLIENPSTYLQFRSSEIPEPLFLVEAAQRSGAGLLLDVNNLFVSCCNHGWDSEAYLSAIPVPLVGEIHLAGHTVQQVESGTLRIDDHGSPVCREVWALYRKCIAATGPVPTLLERDSNIPAFAELMREADLAEQVLKNAHASHPAVAH